MTCTNISRDPLANQPELTKLLIYANNYYNKILKETNGVVEPFELDTLLLFQCIVGLLGKRRFFATF